MTHDYLDNPNNYEIKHKLTPNLEFFLMHSIRSEIAMNFKIKIKLKDNLVDQFIDYILLIGYMINNLIHKPSRL